MTYVGPRSLTCIAALVAAACLTVTPAAALTVAPPDRTCGGDSCYVTKVASTKVARTKRVQRQARVRRADRRRVVRRTHRTRVAIWQGFGSRDYWVERDRNIN